MLEYRIYAPPIFNNAHNIQPASKQNYFISLYISRENANALYAIVNVNHTVCSPKLINSSTNLLP